MKRNAFCTVYAGSAVELQPLQRRGLSLLMFAAAAIAALIATVITAAPADAHVLEVGKDGVVSIRAADGHWTGQPIEVSISAVTAAGNTDHSGVPEAALTMMLPTPVPADVDLSFRQAAAAANVSPALLEALVWQESRWRENAISPKGALGLTQLMPGTARELLVDPRDRAANLAGGARYLRRMLDLFDGDIEKALAAYNAGPGRVRSAGGVPAIAETRAYVSAILTRVGSTSWSGVTR